MCNFSDKEQIERQVMIQVMETQYNELSLRLPKLTANFEPRRCTLAHMHGAKCYKRFSTYSSRHLYRGK